MRRKHEPTVDARKALFAVALAVVLAGAAFTVVGEVAQVGRIQTFFSRANKAWLPLCLVGQLLAYVGYVLAHRDAARASGGPRFGLWTTARIVIFGQGASVLGASVGGHSRGSRSSPPAEWQRHGSRHRGHRKLPHVPQTRPDRDERASFRPRDEAATRASGV